MVYFNSGCLQSNPGLGVSISISHMLYRPSEKSSKVTEGGND